MFTGIIESVGRIRAVEPRGGDMRLRVEAGELDVTDIKIGDSIAVSGVCLTVVERDGKLLVFDVSGETAARTTFSGARAGAYVNLEKALLPITRLGGHLVSGHVDGVGTVTGREAAARSVRLTIEAPQELAKYIAVKGSICVDGVSLTVNQVDGAEFGLNLIPHTLAETTFNDLDAGRRVNLEVDILARYLERLLLGEGAAKRGSAITAEFLRQHGFLK